MKKLISLVLIFGGLFMLSNTANAASGDKIPGESVYASVSDQDAVYSAVLNSKELEFDGITVVKESITPVYVVDFLDYAKTGVFKISPSVVDSAGRSLVNTSDNPGNFYIAKTITADGLFGGNIRFLVADGVAYLKGFTPSEHFYKQGEDIPGGAYSCISYSYADHAKRIQDLLGRDSFVPPEDVRYVLIDNFGYAFYINDGKQESLVMLSYSYGVPSEYYRDIIYIGDELKEMANKRLSEYNEHLQIVKDWEAAHPGEKYSVTGGFLPLQNNIKDTDNVVNIADYLKSSNDVGSLKTKTGLKPETIFAIIAVALLIAFTTLAVFKVKKTKNINK